MYNSGSSTLIDVTSSSNSAGSGITALTKRECCGYLITNSEEAD